MQQQSVEARKSEIGAPLQNTLSATEQAELQTLNEELTNLKQQAVTLGSTRVETENERNSLTQELSEYLNRRQREVKEELAKVAVSDEELILQQRQADLDIVKKSLAEVTANIASMKAPLPVVLELIIMQLLMPQSSRRTPV